MTPGVISQDVLSPAKDSGVAQSKADLGLSHTLIVADVSLRQRRDAARPQATLFIFESNDE